MVLGMACRPSALIAESQLIIAIHEFARKTFVIFTQKLQENRLNSFAKLR